MQKKHRALLFSFIGISLIALITVLIFHKPQTSYSRTTKEGFISDLMNNLDGAKNRQSLIASFCKATAKAETFGDPNEPGLSYDPGQSLFLGVLCSKSTDRKKIENLVIGYDREKELNIPGCTRDSSMNECDFSVFLPKLFALVMNDLSKAKLSQLYGYQGTSTDEAVKAFSDTYFGPGVSICGSEDVIYLGDTQGSPREASCLHPQTRATLVQYINQAKKMAGQTKYINSQTLLTLQGENCKENSNEFLTCAFASNNPYALDAFHNTVYNELMFYRILIVLAHDRFQHPEYNRFRVNSDTTLEAEQELARLEEEVALSEQATMYMDKTLKNMHATFPIHIGLLAYYEDVVAFRKSLLQIYTPLHQLYYKLRNVQQKS